MAVMTASLKPVEIKTVNKKKLVKKSVEKCRPITATLEHPLILDIKLLQKLDMTTFTKRGLVALSKFCGISLITHKTGSKQKLLKSIQGPLSNRQVSKDHKDRGNNIRMMVTKHQANGNEEATDKAQDQIKCKRVSVKPKILKLKSQFNFKIVELKASVRRDGTGTGNGNEAEAEDDSTDVVCKKHSVKGITRTSRQKHNPPKRKSVSGDVLTNEVVPEPCKSCSRSQHPERLHSHPRIPAVKMDAASEEGPKTPVKLNSEVARKNSDKFGGRKKSFCAKGLTSPQKTLLSVRHDSSHTSPTSVGRRHLSRDGSGKSPSSVDLQEQADSRKVKKSPTPGRTSSNVETSTAKLAGSRTTDDSKKDEPKSTPHSPVNDALKYVSGCYICGNQVSPKTRMKHEKECISEWRNQNSLLPPEERRPEPKRPDYRFTESGDVDFEGTFESIWANHQDSLVPCKTCGRTFFPDRIERHETCCSNLALRLKYKK